MTLDRTENWWNARLCTAWCSSVRTGLLGNNKNIYHAIKPQHEMPLSVWVCMCLKGRNVFPVCSLTHKLHFCLASELILFLYLLYFYFLSVSYLIFNNVFKNDLILNIFFFTYKYRCTNVKYQIIMYFYFVVIPETKIKRAWIWLLLSLQAKQNYGPFLKARTLWAKMNVKVRS